MWLFLFSWCGESRESFKQRIITEAPRSLLCVSTDCAAERSCTQSGAPSPSQSASAHTLSSAKSKGSLRRQSKSVVWLCLFAVYIFCLCCIAEHLWRPVQQEMSENGGGGQQMVKARFNFKQNNEDELSFSKGDVILVTRQEEGGWWEGTLNGKTGWFPSNYVREIKPCGEFGPLFQNIAALQTMRRYADETLQPKYAWWFVFCENCYVRRKCRSMMRC